jgi:hypothetical protein
VYLRELSHPLRLAAGLPDNTLFPLVRVNRLGPFLRLAKIELGREAATIFMLAAVAFIGRRWLPAFAVVFGVWDLAFYGWLKVLIAWPESLFTWDLLFLIPVPWTSPVLAPMIVAGSMVGGGIAALVRQPKRTPPLAAALLTAGAILVLTAFMWDWRNVVSGSLPGPFPWAIFLSGEALAIAGCWIGVKDL